MGVAFPFLLAATVNAAETEVSSTKRRDDDMLKEVLQWATENGAYISPKIESRHIVGDLSGIFAKEPMEKGEVVSTIPWHLIIGPPKGSPRGFCAGVEAALAILKKNPAEQNPYEKYLISRPKNFHPLFWSKRGRGVLRKIMGYDLPPSDEDFDLKNIVKDYECDQFDGADVEDDLMQQALMLTLTRTEGEKFDHLVPFNDLINHAATDEEYTADPKFEIGTHYQIVARRDLNADEEIRNSYNKCEWCESFSNSPTLDHMFVTPHIFEHYGFIEPVPQRWIVPSSRLFFDVFKEEKSDTLKAKFAVPPSPYGIQYLTKEITRLEESANLLDAEASKHLISAIEMNTIREYRQAILTAYKLALEETGTNNTIVSDEVWYRDRGRWWEEPDVNGGIPQKTTYHYHLSEGRPIRRRVLRIERDRL
ncbi:MAG: hypothetical protein SGILL_001424 [Bacillariaceae sp.]